MLSSPSSSEKESSSQPKIYKPKKFLKKGEGLKRFAAYNPAPPTTVKKVGRRKTFVKFKLDEFHPELFANDSINLSTEIPKIAPPKIIHTPVKTRPAQTFGNINEYEDFNDEQDSDHDHNQQLDAGSMHESVAVTEENYIGDEESEIKEEQEDVSGQPSNIPVKTEKDGRRYNLRGIKKRDDLNEPSKEELPKAPKKTRRKAVVETSQARPKDMNTIARHIQLIQSTVIELKENILREQPADRIQQVACAASIVKPTKRRSRIPKKSITKLPETPQPLERSESINSELITTLVNEIENLKATFDEINTKK